METPDSDLEQDDYHGSDRDGVLAKYSYVPKKPLINYDVAFYGRPIFKMIPGPQWPRFYESICANSYFTNSDDTWRGTIHGVFCNPRTGVKEDNVQGYTDFIVEGIYTNIYATLPKWNVFKQDPFEYNAVINTNVVVWIELLHIPGEVSPWDYNGYNYFGPGFTGSNPGLHTWDELYEVLYGDHLNGVTLMLRSSALRRGVKSIWKHKFNLERGVRTYTGKDFDNHVTVMGEDAIGQYEQVTEGAIGTDAVLLATKAGRQVVYQNYSAQQSQEKAAWGPIQQHVEKMPTVFTHDDYCPVNRIIETKNVATDVRFKEWAQRGSFVIAAWSSETTPSVYGSVLPDDVDVYESLPRIDINMRFRMRQRQS